MTVVERLPGTATTDFGNPGRGRSLDGIIAHVIGADGGYLAAVGWKPPKAAKPADQLAATREAIVAALEASTSGGDSVPRPAPQSRQ